MGKKTSSRDHKVKVSRDRAAELQSALTGLVAAVDRALGSEDSREFKAAEIAAVQLRQAMETATSVIGGAQWDNWGDWEMASGDVAFPDLPESERPYRVFRNNLFEVWVRLSPMMGEEGNPTVAELSIKRRDKLPIDYNHWRTLQRIKDEVLGINIDAAALYPCASRLQDSANQYRVYALPGGMLMPFGDNARVVSSVAALGDDNPRNGPRQRPFPADRTPVDDLAHDPARLEELGKQVTAMVGERDDEPA